jgi:hypothetical protein
VPIQKNPQVTSETPSNAMLWLIIFLLWGFRTALYGHVAGRPTLRVLLTMLAVLGVLQVIVSIIDVIQYVQARWIES